MPQIRFCSASRGDRIAYAIDGRGPPIVFPAWWISHVEKDWEHVPFRKFFGALAQHHTVVRYDRVGVGLSDRQRSENEITVAREVADLSALIDHLGFEQTTLFAISCGGPTAVTYAKLNPTRTSQIVLHGSYLQGCTIGTPEIREAMIALVRASWGLGSKTLASVFTPTLSPEEIRRTSSLQKLSADSEVAAQLLNLTYVADISAEAPSVDVPCLVLHRDRDSAIPFDSGRQLAATLPNASFAPLEGSAHPPWEGDATSVLEQVFSFLGTKPAAEPSDTALHNALIQQGDVWTLSFDAVQAHLKHSKGLKDLHALLSRPGQEVSAMTLMQGAEPTTPPSGSDDVLDAQAKAEFKSRIDTITAELQEARDFNDLGRIERLEHEQEAILAELQAATGLGGRSRKLKDPAERARKAVSARIKEAIARIADAHPEAGTHLSDAVSTGTYCSYDPNLPIAWDL